MYLPTLLLQSASEACAQLVLAGLRAELQLQLPPQALALVCGVSPLHRGVAILSFVNVALSTLDLDLLPQPC